MSYIETNPIKNSTILRMYSERDEIKLDPEYQRHGEVWTLEKKRLLIDSILNDYDIPKIYFHVLDRTEKSKTGLTYAVIDGRQRLETIWQFVAGKFSLDKDFVYLQNESVQIKEFTYADISKKYPKIKINFDSFVLPIVGVKTDEMDLIEDMFSRLNEAVPLNAAEKRNAIGGDMAIGIRKISKHKFFKENVKFTNKRYQHREIAARFLLLLESENNLGKIIDTKKVYLDAMTKHYKRGKRKKVERYVSTILAVLDAMVDLFSFKDPLLLAQGAMTVYFLLFREALNTDRISLITRPKFLNFGHVVRENRIIAEKDISKAIFSYLEYDRRSQQGTNDASSIKERVEILKEFLGFS